MAADGETVSGLVWKFRVMRLGDGSYRVELSTEESWFWRAVGKLVGANRWYQWGRYDELDEAIAEGEIAIKRMYGRQDPPVQVYP